MSSGGQTGANGAIGYTGSVGVGYTGSIGTIGYTGSIGTIGYTGSTGFSYNVTTKTTSYTLQSSDYTNLIPTNSNIIIPASTFTAGQSITIFNSNSSNISISSASGVTAYLVGSSNTSTRTVLPYGLATILCVNTANVFVITGGGVF
jgi:hypothetical protein